MAKAKPAEAPADTPAPTFREAVDASQAARQEELQANVDKVALEHAPAPEAPAAPEESYEDWYNKQPEKFRKQYADNVVNWHAQKLSEDFGPEISQVLGMVRENPELKKKLSRLTDEQYQKWVFDTATNIYDDPTYSRSADGSTGNQRDPAVSELSKKFDDLSTKLSRKEQEDQQAAYIERRRSEYQALINTFEDLKWTNQTDPGFRRAEAVIERAESQKRPYADVYNEMKSMWDWQKQNPPPKEIPRAQSTDTTPARTQAPRNKVEAKAAIKSQLDKYGSLSALNSALRK